jgi:nitrate reductase delta subunit
MKRRDRTVQDRLVWQSTSLLLAYPDEGHSGRLDIAERLLEHVVGESADHVGKTLAALRELDPMRAAIEYVDTFDLRKRSTMYLTYWTAGDTRNRGMEMLAFTRAYRAAGSAPPKHEAPDHLPIVLEFAATVDPAAGRALLTAHRVAIDVLRQALVDADSPYASAITAVCATLPAVGCDDARRLMMSGPPAEAVGLQPFQLTVPPRPTQGVH